ncbi:hypothetical protein [Lysinibacillus sp. ACHW1.5]|uniref:hypothetical protein n=1 Tax=Lysinibacillus sp. ACHW1.5 TaxID=2913506 RepID=UPI001EDA06AE|nr:hypothetical protein [Lysinibacillus sp. ACHW1.5]UKJ44675.1 hypothetical protein L6W14_18425 [Lysinibacillus sp. ACHW1.5]
MKICRYCRHLNPVENNYCEKCELSFKDSAVRKRYYNEKDDPLTNIKKNEQEYRKKTSKGAIILSFFGGVLGILIILGIPIGGYLYLNQDVNTYNKAVDLWNEGEIKEALEVAKKIPEDSRQYKKTLKLIKNAEEHLLYSKSVELWNEGEIKESVEVAKKIPKDSIQYKKAQKLIKDGKDYLLYNKAAALWNDGNYEEAVKIFESFTEESEYYKQAQSVLKDM